MNERVVCCSEEACIEKVNSIVGVNIGVVIEVAGLMDGIIVSAEHYVAEKVNSVVGINVAVLVHIAGKIVEVAAIVTDVIVCIVELVLVDRTVTANVTDEGMIIVID